MISYVSNRTSSWIVALAFAACAGTEPGEHVSPSAGVVEPIEAPPPVGVASTSAPLTASIPVPETSVLESEQERVTPPSRRELRRVSALRDALGELAAVREEPRGLVVTLGGHMFAPRHAVLRSDARQQISRLAAVLVTDREGQLLVEGHMDSQDDSAASLALSTRRAEAVRDMLITSGYPAGRIRARGLGATRPLQDNETPKGRAANRRVELVLEQSSPVSMNP